MAPLPAPGPDEAFFWTSGSDGRLRFLRCRACGTFLHPPSPRCPRCLSADVQPEPVTGTGTVQSFTFVTGAADAPPDVVAWIGFPEQDDLRMTARLVGVAPADAAIGMAVTVEFEEHEDVHLPVFRAAGGPADHRRADT